MCVCVCVSVCEREIGHDGCERRKVLDLFVNMCMCIIVCVMFSPFAFVCLFVCVYLFMFVCVFVYLCVCVCVFVCVRVC